MKIFLTIVRAGIVLFIGGVLLLAAIGKLLDNRYFSEVLGVVLSLLELALAYGCFPAGARAGSAGFGVVLPRLHGRYGD